MFVGSYHGSAGQEILLGARIALRLSGSIVSVQANAVLFASHCDFFVKPNTPKRMFKKIWTGIDGILSCDAKESRCGSEVRGDVRELRLEFRRNLHTLAGRETQIHLLYVPETRRWEQQRIANL